jgi:hypothetical protein
VQQKKVSKSYMNETLQPSPNVLLSGPFKKRFPASHGTNFSTASVRCFQRQTSGNQALSEQQLDAKPAALHQRRAIAQVIVDEPFRAVNLGDAGKD